MGYNAIVRCVVFSLQIKSWRLSKYSEIFLGRTTVRPWHLNTLGHHFIAASHQSSMAMLQPMNTQMKKKKTDREITEIKNYLLPFMCDGIAKTFLRRPWVIQSWITTLFVGQPPLNQVCNILYHKQNKHFLLNYVKQKTLWRDVFLYIFFYFL